LAQLGLNAEPCFGAFDAFDWLAESEFRAAPPHSSQQRLQHIRRTIALWKDFSTMFDLGG
jgi:hypothetical protein